MKARSLGLRNPSLAIAVICSGAVVAWPAHAADQAEDTEISTVTVTGSLIPQKIDVETAAPLTVISADDMQVRGFTSIANALQESAFSTGSVQGAQYSGGFTQGAKTLSLFGLSPSYVKYLIDGRPMVDYPALYNGTDIITSISGIPMELVDHIDILPGGQSSIYGSDAIAGVVNIVMRKDLDAPLVNLSYQTFEGGGGRDRRATAAGSFDLGSARFLAGVEVGKIDPIWGYQRDRTNRYFTEGTSEQVAERDYLVLGNLSSQYFFQDPNNCANVTGQFNGSVTRRTRAGRGDYCGTTNAGYYTVSNGADQLNGYLHGTLDVGEAATLYTDVLASRENVEFTSGTKYYSTDIDFGGVWDPNLQDLLTLQHIFSPEETGGLHNHMDESNTRAYSATLGGTGVLMASNWTYDLAFTHASQKLTEHTDLLFTNPIEDFFASILGDNLGNDPVFDFYPTFTPDYEAFYTPVTPEQYASFSGDTTSRSKTTDSMLRAQVTNSSLFSMPAGDAGLAVVAEYGRQKWNYDPDPRFLNGEAFAFTATAGGGKRSRYALTSEVRLPVLKPLTFTASGRYDNYRVSGENVDKATYMLGLELRPVRSLLVRGRYGTAFKAPTLSDEFQGLSGFYQQVPDYYVCQQQGYDFAHATECPYYGYYFGQTSGNTALKPINAKVWDVGFVFAPIRNLSLTADLLHWNIDDEVSQQDSDQLLRDEAQCRDGTLDPGSSTCAAALSQVTRDDGGFLVSFVTPKINVSNEELTAITIGATYDQAIGRLGRLRLQAAWNDLLKHRYQQYAGEEVINLLTNPYWSTEFKSSANASLTWDYFDKVSATLYVNRRGKAPNYLASLTPDGYAIPGAGRLKAWTIFDLNVGYQLTSHFNLSATVDNLFDKMPPLDRSYPGTELQPYNVFNYNIYGRSYMVEMVYRFGK